MQKIYKLKIIIIELIIITVLTAPCLADNKAEFTKNGAAAKKELKDINWLLFSDTR